MGFAEIVTKGMNNPDCSFYVGQTFGQITTVGLLARVMLVYFGIKLLDKMVFKGLPMLYKKFKRRGKK
ncbi:hypothetical protein LCGC14_2033970 [marine sediment metagenome]|uniref:Uncharacterized protein n=1 Tax=marine sediment metagenome TaxID=412755 RepID=A0A0F9EU27_9ZZZZ